MNKKKILGFLLSGAMIATMAGTATANKVNHNNINKSNMLLAEPSQINQTGYACVINGNNKLVLTNKEGQVVSFLSVGEMLNIQSTQGNKTLVTVEETGATGYIDNSNMLFIQNANTDNITRMNRNGYIINVSNSVNLRVGPGMNQQVIQGLSNNTPVRITGKTGNWYRVSVGKNRGYIFSEYVAESNAKNSTIVPPAVNGTTNHVTQQGNTSTIYNSVATSTGTVANGSVANNSTEAPVPTTHVKVVNHDVQPSTLTNTGNTNVKPSTPVHNGGIINPSSPVANPNSGTQVTPSHEKGTNTPANPSKYKPVPSGVNGQKGDTVHGTVVTPSKPSTGNTGSTTAPTKPSTNNGGTIHDGSTTPGHHTDVMAAPTLTAHNYKLVIGKTFSNSMLDAQANEGATISYDGHVNNMKPGTYPITVTATNSQGGKTVAKVNVEVVDVVPTINAENYTMTQGNTFNMSDLNISAYSQLGTNLTKDVKISGSVDTMKPGTYPITISVTDQFGATNERTVEVTVNKAANPVFTCKLEVTTPFGVQVLGTQLGVNVLGNTNDTNNFIITTSGNVNYQKAGTYEITVTVTNKLGGSSSKQVKIIVEPQVVKPTTPTKPNNVKPSTPTHSTTPTKPAEPTKPTTPVKPAQPAVQQGTLIVETVMPDGSVVQGSMTSRTGNAGTEVSVNGPQLVEGYNLAYTTIDGTKTTDIPSNMSIVGGVTNTIVYHLEKAAPVKEAAPVITASNKTVQQGTTWNNNMIGATANENATVSYSGDVNTSQPGNYQVTVTAKNSQGTISTKVVNVTVEAMGAPVISGHNVTLNVGHKFNTSMIGASATVNGNPVQVSYTENVNTNEEGTYNVTVTASNGFGKVAKQVYTVTVNDSATLVAHNYTMTAGQSFNLSDLNIVATNINGTDISGSAKIISGSVNTNEAGTYNITIQVNDGEGATATQTVTVTVKAKPVAPVVTASPVTIIAGNQLSNSMFHASSSESNVQWNYDTSNVNTNTPGTYNVTITATNAEGLVGTDTVQVTVKAKPLAPAQITAQNVTLTQGQTLNDSAFNASSNEAGTTFSYDTSNVNTNIPGTYNVTITATNTQGKVSSVTVQVTVKAKAVVNTFTPNGTNGAGTFTGQVPVGLTGHENVTNIQAYIQGSQAYKSAYNQALFNDINQFREANGLQAFKWSDDLAYMANWKSNDCVTHNYFAHKDLQGQYTNDVFSNQIHFGSWCENLVGGSGVYSNITVNAKKIVTQKQIIDTAEATFQAWKASPGHRANMLSNNTYGAVGIDEGIATMEAATMSSSFNPITGTFTDAQQPSSMQNPGPNVFTVVMPNKNK